MDQGTITYWGTKEQLDDIMGYYGIHDPNDDLYDRLCLKEALNE